MFSSEVRDTVLTRQKSDENIREDELKEGGLPGESLLISEVRDAAVVGCEGWMEGKKQGESILDDGIEGKNKAEGGSQSSPYPWINAGNVRSRHSGLRKGKRAIRICRT